MRARRVILRVVLSIILSVVLVVVIFWIYAIVTGGKNFERSDRRAGRTSLCRPP
jgi:ATP/ADP translocase